VQQVLGLRQEVAAKERWGGKNPWAKVRVQKLEQEVQVEDLEKAWVAEAKVKAKAGAKAKVVEKVAARAVVAAEKVANNCLMTSNAADPDIRNRSPTVTGYRHEINSLMDGHFAHVFFCLLITCALT